MPPTRSLTDTLDTAGVFEKVWGYYPFAGQVRCFPNSLSEYKNYQLKVDMARVNRHSLPVGLQQTPTFLPFSPGYLTGNGEHGQVHPRPLPQQEDPSQQRRLLLQPARAGPGMSCQ